MRLNQRSIQQLKSGQQVWRVRASVDNQGQFTVDVTWHPILGKKILYHFKNHHGEIYRSSVRMQWNKPIEAGSLFGYPRWYGNAAYFLSDLLNDASFTKEKEARQFAQQILNGDYPEIYERAWQAYHNHAATNFMFIRTKNEVVDNVAVNFNVLKSRKYNPPLTYVSYKYDETLPKAIV